MLGTLLPECCFSLLYHETILLAGEGQMNKQIALQQCNSRSKAIWNVVCEGAKIIKHGFCIRTLPIMRSCALSFCVLHPLVAGVVGPMLWHLGCLSHLQRQLPRFGILPLGLIVGLGSWKRSTVVG